MMKSSLIVKNNVGVNKYSKLIAFLKCKSEGYRPKKSKILTTEQMNEFITKARSENRLDSYHSET